MQTQPQEVYVPVANAEGIANTLIYNKLMTYCDFLNPFCKNQGILRNQYMVSNQFISMNLLHILSNNKFIFRNLLSISSIQYICSSQFFLSNQFICSSRFFLSNQRICSSQLFLSNQFIHSRIKLIK